MSLLCVGIDHKYVKACLCDQVSGQWRLIAWLNEQAPVAMTDDLQIEVEPTVVTSKVRWAAATLGRFLDHDLLLNLPPQSADGQRSAPYSVERVLLTVSPLAPSRVWVMALTPLWLSLLEDLIQSVEAHLVGVTICDHRMNSLLCSRDLALAAPDLIVVCGGYDIDGSTPPTLGLMAQVLGDSLHEHGPVPVIYAGSAQGSREFAHVLQTQIANLELTVVENIVPQPDLFRGDSLHATLLEFCYRTSQNSLGEEIRNWSPSGSDWGSHSVNFLRVLQLWQAQFQPGSPVHGVHYSGDNRVHVLLNGSGPDSVQTAHGSSVYQPDAVSQWPEPLVVSGIIAFQSDSQLGCVNDPRGFMPLLAPMFDIHPEAAWSILTQELLVPATPV